MDFIGAMFGFGGYPLWSSQTTYYLINYALLLVVAILGSTPVVNSIAGRLQASQRVGKIVNIIEPFAIAAVLLLCVATLVNDSFTPFLYFQF